ncbi:MAG: DUF2062 domain-containing protein [Desulfuromonadales bacterium]
MCTVTGFSSSASQRLKHLKSIIAEPVTQRLQGILSCGLTPKKLVLTLCIGTALGILPLVWGTSLICFMLAHLFKLNHLVLQSVNYLLYPLQLVLLVPFFKLGTWLFPGGPPMPPHLLATMVRHPGNSLSIIGWITFKSLAAWMATVFPAVLLVCIVFKAATHKNKVRT